ALLAANAYFITAEFAPLTLHRARVEQQARDGDPWANRWLPALFSPGPRLLTAQLGSSVAAPPPGVTLARLTLARAGSEALPRPAQLGSGVASRLLGFTVARLSLAWVGQGPFARAGALIASFAVAALLHAGLSAQVPKLVGIHRAGVGLARVVIPPLRLLELL